MKLLCFCVVLVQVSALSVNDNDLRSSTHRSKRQNVDRWIWGEYIKEPDTPAERIRDRDGPTTTTEAPNPCNRPEPTFPDFSAPGRRISEVKCYEYIYSIKAREEKAKNDKACTDYLIAQGTPPLGVLGGRDARVGEIPHMAAIGWKAATGTGWIFKCGGSLISDKFVLTAGHCTQASDRDTSIADVVPKVVRLGDIFLLDRDSPVNADIVRIIAHPSYQPPKKYFDIALIEINTEYWFSKLFTENIQPACLFTGSERQLIGRSVSLSGWGVINTVTKDTSPVLQVAVVDVIDSQQCDGLLRPSCNRHWCGMQNHQICAGKLAGGVDACQGDSGGPLQLNVTLPRNTKGVMYQIVGVTSFGIGCALQNLPGIYTKVTSFLDWIESIVWT